MDRKYGLTHSKVADVLGTSPDFVARVAKAEREFSPRQTKTIADHLGVGMGAMFIDASPMKPNLKPEYQEIVDLCERLMLLADSGLTAVSAEPLKKPA